MFQERNLNKDMEDLKSLLEFLKQKNTLTKIHTHTPSLNRLNCRIEKRVRTSELEDRKTETSQSE